MVVSVAAGVLLLAVLVHDVYTTVLVPRGGAGPVTRRVYAGFWWVWRRVGDRAGGRRRAVLAAGGPLLLPLTVALWAVELVVGFALVYLPFSGSFSVEGDQDVHPVVTALYVSGYSATTLGVGDVSPTSPGLRMLTVVEAALGFALFSASIAYLLSVYGALLRSTSLALDISRYVGTRDQQDAVDVLADAVRHDATAELLSWLRSSTARMAEARQAEAQYPLTAYFHVPDDDRGLPQSIGTLLELLTVARALLDPVSHPELTRGRTVSYAFRTGTSVVAEGSAGLSTTVPEPSDEERGSRHDAARSRLEQAGVSLRPVEQSRRDYVALRAAWDGDQRRLRAHYGYPPRG